MEEEIQNFIPDKTLKAEKNFETKLDYGNDYKKYIEEDINSNDSDNYFSQAELNDRINNNSNLISSSSKGDIITISNEKCLFIGQYEKNEKLNLLNKNIILTGKGSLYYKNGAKYEGIFIKGKINGLGRYISPDGVCYEGIFKDGIMQGKGKQIKINEEGEKFIYEGILVNYIKEGKGKLECKEFIYNGDFKNDKREGKGKLIYKDDGNIYEGDFKDDKIHGYGLYTFKNKHIYQGEIVNGTFHGKGTYKWPDGTYFIGQYVNGEREGMGEYKFSDGNIFNGPFLKGKPHGKGTLNVKGKIYNCEFKYGKLIKDSNHFFPRKKKV